MCTDLYNFIASVVARFEVLSGEVDGEPRLASEAPPPRKFLPNPFATFEGSESRISRSCLTKDFFATGQVISARTQSSLRNIVSTGIAESDITASCPNIRAKEILMCGLDICFLCVSWAGSKKKSSFHLKRK